MINTIVISGKAGHGKTTLANLIKEELENQNFRVMKIAFADYLKFIAKKYYGWNGEKDEKQKQINNCGCVHIYNTGMHGFVLL